MWNFSQKERFMDENKMKIKGNGDLFIDEND